MQDIPDLLEGLRRTPRVLAEFVKAIPEDRLDVRRGEGFWTIAEHVSHLAQVQPVILERFQRFMHEDHPAFVPTSPATAGRARFPCAHGDGRCPRTVRDLSRGVHDRSPNRSRYAAC